MFNEKIYIPKDSLSFFSNYTCHLIDNGVIISFNDNITCSNNYCLVPTFQVFLNNHYLVQNRDLYLEENQYNAMVSSCSYNNYTNFTSDVFYRHDIDSILIIFLILILILFLFPFRIISRMFGRWFKW